MTTNNMTYARLAIWLALALAARAPGAETNTAAGLDWKSFQVIAERNIFNQSRSGRVKLSDKAAKPPRVDNFKLLGTMSYDKGTVAFFGGSASEFRKALKIDGRIAGYSIAGISHNAVKLVSTNSEPVELRVGMQMRREEDGPWTLSGRASSDFPVVPIMDEMATDAAAADKPEAGAGGAELDVLKRLMQKREQELKNK